MEWGKFSTWDGVTHLALADSAFARLFWAILVAASISAFVYLVFCTFIFAASNVFRWLSP